MISDYAKVDIDSFLKYLSVFAFIFLLVDMYILIITPPLSGYEPSIYGAYPFAFWLFMGTCISLSVLNIVLSAGFDSNNWKYGLISIFLCYTTLLFFPVIRGYEFFAQTGYDMFYHFASIYEIINSGYLPDDLFYPITHILTVVLLYVGVPFKFSYSLISVIFLLLYILFFYMLGKTFFKNKPNSRFLLAFSLPFMFSFLHYAFIPFFFALSILPLFLYCFHNRNSNNGTVFNILILILAIFVVFAHPLVTIFLLIFLILCHVFFLVRQKNEFIIYDHNSFSSYRLSNLIIIVTISFLIWYLNFYNIQLMFSSMLDALFDQGHTTVLNSHIGLIQSSNASILDIAEIFIKVYGSILMYFFIASCFFIFILNKLRSKSVEELDLFYGFQFLVSVLFGLSLILGYFIVFEPVRTFSFAITMSTIFCGIIFGKLNENAKTKSRKKWVNLFVVIIICSSCVLGILNIYESPWKIQASPDMNTMMINGLDWFLNAKNESVPLASDFDSIYNYEMYHSKLNSNQTYNDLKYTILNGTIPSHFGYNTNNTLLASLGYDTKYMIISEYILQSFKYGLKSQQLKYPIYSKSDFQKLNNDSTANKLYMNGEFELWLCRDSLNGSVAKNIF